MMVAEQTFECPLCGQSGTEAVLPTRYDNDGFPIEGAARAGFGVPVIAVPTPFDVYLDGAPVPQAIAFSRAAGWVWSHRTDEHGDVCMNRGRDGVDMVKLCGTVTLKRSAPR